ncbi:MAG TPA: hypothetical protein VM925_32785 [Labilithrix sp.]|nr:hypothetical protein [Labilithrix sp.]
MKWKGRGRSLAFFLTFGGLVPLVTSACVSEDPGSGPPAPTCERYCSLVAQKCGGPNQQYRDTAECLSACSLLELGSATDGDTNSIGCRMRKAESAATQSASVDAGPFGGGVCGSRCASYCRIVGKSCLELETPIFGGSEGTCNEQCPTFRFDPNEGEGPLQEFAGNNSLNCRSHHLILSLKSPADAKNHCPHAGVDSATCRR